MRWYPLYWLPVAAVLLFIITFTSGGKGQAQQPAIQVSSDKCLDCHKGIVQLYAKGKHAPVNCAQCHPKAAAHAAAHTAKKVLAAETDYRWESCGFCHINQYTTMKMDDPVKIGPFGGTPREMDHAPKVDEYPLINKIIAGHGFTAEYNEDRSHKLLMKVHITTQRKQNAACLNCKSTAVAYFWNRKWNGVELNEKADWKTIIDHLPQGTQDYGMSCSHCHDPHSAQPRLVHQLLKNTIAKNGVNPYWKEKNVKSFEAADKQQQQSLVCSQCHVEYACGPGADKQPHYHFAWSKVRDVHDYYTKECNYQQDWKHGITGETMVKMQHPDTETFWESKYERAGASCVTCHMPKLTWEGKTFTSHWMTSPFKYLDRYIKGDKEYGAYPCQQCHPNVPAEKLMEKAINVQKSVYELQKKAQEALSDCIDAIAAAKKAQNVDAAKLQQAVENHRLAHVRWEGLAVAENSMGFHNPEEVLPELNKAVEFARKAGQLAKEAVK